MEEQVLSDLKVLDFTWHIAGPYCTKLLADYGADVIKVERPEDGDLTRHMGPFFNDDPHREKSGLFLHLNTNKKSISLNIKSDLGKKVVKELIKDVDILVENFRPGVMKKLGFDYETLQQLNPKLVMISISNFGQTGPYRDFKASDIIIYGMGGSMNTCGLPDREPTKKALTAVLFSAGSMAAFATMIAIYASKINGFGEYVDFSLFEAQMAGIDRRMSNLLAYTYNDEITPKSDPRDSFAYPYGIQPCADGDWELAGHGALWPGVGKMMGMPELIDDPRFNTMVAQSQPGHREEFLVMFLPWSLEHNKMECIKLGQEAGVLCGPLYNMEELLNDPHFQYRNFWEEIDHPVTGKLTYPGGPIHAKKMPWIIRSPAPLLGEHNEEIYCDRLGYNQEDLVSLKQGRII
jgi:crotonobetainyl-CoA:carnitine CoA-transferase CaiB-like acyl-CoA transferase